MMRYLLPLAVFLGVAAHAQNVLPNSSFEEGADQPAGWELQGGSGKWESAGHTGRRCLSVTGDGQNSNFWAAVLPDLPVMGVFRMSFWGRSLPGTSGGCFVSGPDFCNRDYGFTENWSRYSSVLCIPSRRPGAVCRLGQWTVNGTGQFDDVELRPVLPVYATEGEVVLGDGEEVAGNQYTFKPNYGGPGSNHSRCLVSATASFNSSRFCFGPGSEVIYKQQVGATEQTAARVHVNVGYYQAGTCVVEAAREPGQWQQVGQINALAAKDFDLPASLFPAAAIYIRLRSPGNEEKSADFAPGSFQVHSYEYEATLAQDLGHVTGATSFLDVLQAGDAAKVEVLSMGTLLPGGDQKIVLRVTAQKSMTAQATVQIDSGAASVMKQQLVAGQPAEVSIRYGVETDGNHTLNLSLNADNAQVWQAQTEFFVPSLYAGNYGHLIAAGKDMALWWCEGTYKVSQERAAPQEQAPVRFAAARNEYEPVQIVLRPNTALPSLSARIGDFAGPGSAKIPHSAFSLRTVEYLKVTIPTDGSSTPGWWPDPLPTLTPGRALAAGRNYPIWLTVKVPADARAGLYNGKLSLDTGSSKATVPIQLQVYDFTMPAKSHLTTCWGFSWGRVTQYQNLTNPDDQRKVHDLYMQDFREHRIAPYDFSQFGPIGVSVTGVNWSGGKIVDDQAAEGKHSLMVVDDSTTGNVEAAPLKNLPIEQGATYRISWVAKTAQPDQKVHLTLGCHDANGQWFSGRNIDLIYDGSTDWKRQEVTLGPERFPAGCTQVNLSLRGAQWSEKGENTGTVWWDDLYFGKADGGPNLIPDPSFEEGYGQVKVLVDFTGFDREAERYIDQFGFNAFALPIHFLGYGRTPSFTKGRIGPFEEGTPEYERIFADYLKQLQDHLEQKGWLDEQYIYWFDEPEPGDYDFVRSTNERIHKYAPKLNRMLTEEPQPALFGAVDTWCPVTFNYDRRKCQARQAAGEKVWWYVCTGPRAPYAGLFIDHGATDLRVWLWQTWQNAVQGCLIWESTWWDSTGSPHRPQNPWTDPMGWTPDGGTWGNGDGRFLYPANQDYPNDKRPYVEGPVDSIRWEMLREGLEDWEYLYLLNQCIQRKLPGAAQYARLLEVPKAISEDMTHFAREPQPIYVHRAKVAAALEKLKADQLGVK